MKNRTLLSRTLLLAIISLAAASSLRADLVAVPENDAPVTSDSATPTVPNAVSPTAPAAAANTTQALPVQTYTVAHGDTLASVAQQYGMTVKELKRLNDLPTTKVSLKAGQVLQVVNVPHSATAKKTAVAAKKKKVTTPVAGTTMPPEYTQAQPVQNFDLSAANSANASTSSSWSAQSVPDNNEYSSISRGDSSAHPAPVAKLVTPADLARDEAQQKKAASALAKTNTSAQATQTVIVQHTPKAQIYTQPSTVTQPVVSSAPQLRLGSKPSFFDRIFSNHDSDSETAAADWGTRFLQQARQLGDAGIGYDDDWRPPGESHSWTMDCSNTSRYLYKVTTGIELPRTASDQYYYLHLQGKAWDVPQGENGVADINYLRTNLKPGDLLFWENTYRPERQPPITHVMIFLGTNDKGEWIMAGSQSSRGGEHNRNNGGPDVYVFRPDQPCGGYTTWMGFVHHKGRFCAFGRPLDADRTKLSVADE